jgi:hypothetical protein
MAITTEEMSQEIIAEWVTKIDEKIKADRKAGKTRFVFEFPLDFPEVLINKIVAIYEKAGWVAKAALGNSDADANIRVIQLALFFD